MSKLLDLIDNIDSIADGKYELADEYQGYNKPLKLRCKVHNIEFYIPQADRLYSMIDNKYFEGCPKCREDKLGRVEVECAYCGKKMIRERRWNRGNKTNLAFCCKEHKILAQRIGGLLVPSHYGTAGRTQISEDSIDINNSEQIQADLNSYRLLALRTYPNRCEICGYDKYKEILEVHHIDEDRTNNNLTNLIVLCPNCHKLVTLSLFTIDRSSFPATLIKVDDPAKVRKQKDKKIKSKSKGGFYTHKLIYCVEDSRYFSTYKNAGLQYHVSDTTIRSAAVSESGFCKSVGKHFKLIDIEEV